MVYSFSSSYINPFPIYFLILFLIFWLPFSAT